ncbi:rhodanese-like domain-containing protein [Aneurinibacillus danicus]|jgi:rhodanese-related sulfurtransferase|uniref:Rhodanese-like domain-containing protein n=1 Tax=Aneurinibacillus danicus TaxID=267746 RepID=A0A511VD78_9BACL|nr:rhodanese-like domain-containing protein [Aneurinibacillus danicus]GEN35898.1 rhodanese-like domain-containing protein [Aneurinibacillus danicus]
MSTYGEISANEVNEQLKQGKKLNLIDVREDEEYAGGRIPGAKHIPLGQIPARLHELDKEKEYIMVCRSGNRSGMASEWLAERGYNVKNMVGGMLEWPGSVEK